MAHCRDEGRNARIGMSVATDKFPGQLKSKVVLIDGLIFQFYRGAPNGISRVWLSLIPLFQEYLEDYSIVLLRRGQYASGLPGSLEYPAREYDFSDVSGGDVDAGYLKSIVAELNPVCFMSTYYSRAPGCPNILLIHDMIPEVMKEDLSKPAWVAKQKAIAEAASFITVSDSTRHDLQKYADVGGRAVKTACNGVSGQFHPLPGEAVAQFLATKDIVGDYLLLVGGRGQYKGAVRFLEAFAQSGLADRYRIVAVGGEPWLSREEEILRGKLNITYTGWIPDDQLALLYCGAFALVYPSLYEGFGLPVAEALACGCPVITPRHSSLPEVAGAAGVYADPGDRKALEKAVTRLETPAVRDALVEEGIRHVGRFSWSNMAGVFVEEIRRYG